MSKEDIWADGYYDGYKAATKWHYPSKGEYPTDVHDVLCCLRNNNIVSGYYSARDEGWYVEAYGFVDEDNWIKAWMLFPDPPKEEA